MLIAWTWSEHPPAVGGPLSDPVGPKLPLRSTPVLLFQIGMNDLLPHG
jgi:hypothetical protein